MHNIIKSKSSIKKKNKKLSQATETETVSNGVSVLQDDSKYVTQTQNNNDYLYANESIEHHMLSGNRNRLKNRIIQSPMQREQAKIKTMYETSNRYDVPLEMSQSTYPQIDNIPITISAQEDRIWNFCVAYAATAMYRKGSADDMSDLLGGGQIGTWYFGALTLFYSIYECTVGGIPPLQKISQELADVFHAVSPCIKNNRAFVIRWNNPNILTLLQTRPYSSLQNPLITLAPWTGILDVTGRRVITNTLPIFTLLDIQENGPRAFEYLQRYLLEQNIPLIPYTSEGRYTNNTSAFATARDSSVNASPVPGFVQVINEAVLPQSDYWLMALQFFAGSTTRDSFNVRTVQIGTHLCMKRIFMGADTTSVSMSHMVDIGTLIAQEISMYVAADVNVLTDTLKDIDSIPIFPSEYLTQLTAGDFLTKVITDSSRRFGFLSAISAGDVLTDSASRLIGAGSRFVTAAYDDNSLGPLGAVEDCAALSSFEFNKQFMFPLLTTRGQSLTVDMDTPGGPSVLYWLHAMYPTTQTTVASYNLATPSPTDIPNTINLSNLLCFTDSDSVALAIRTASSVPALLQGNLAIGNASGSRDGPRTKHLYLTHVLISEPVGAYNLVPTYVVDAVLSTKEMDPRKVSNLITRTLAVFFPITPDHVPAFQTLYRRPHATIVGAEYAYYRAEGWAAHAHKNAANMFSPSENTAKAIHDTIIGDGGNFIDTFFKGGKWISALENLAGGLGNLISPEMGKISKSLAGKVGKGIHDAFSKKGISKLHMAPITHGLISLEDYLHLMNSMPVQKRQPARIQVIK